MQKETAQTQCLSRFILAGAVGLEPTALGFGDHCIKTLKSTGHAGFRALEILRILICILIRSKNIIIIG